MKKSLLALLFPAISIAAFSLFARETIAGKPLYLHEQKKTVRSEEQHLNKFAAVGDVILDFYADWCNPCKRLSPLIDAVAAAMPEFTFIKINRDFFSELAKIFNITSIPTLIFLRDGEEIGRYTGKPLTEQELKKLIIKVYGQ